MDRDFAALAACPLFDGVSEEDARALLDCVEARVVTAERGEAVFLEGSPAEHVGVLLEGAVQVQRHDFDGNRIVRAAVRPGELFGETFACAGVRRLPVSVAATQDSRVLLIRLERLMSPCGRACPFHSRVVLNLLRVMADKNLQLNQKLEITSRKTTREKLLAYLRAQARAAGSATFIIPFDRQGLADYLGVDRSALSTEIGRLRREGVLESDRSAFKLLRTHTEE